MIKRIESKYSPEESWQRLKEAVKILKDKRVSKLKDAITWDDSELKAKVSYMGAKLTAKVHEDESTYVVIPEFINLVSKSGKLDS